MAPHPADNAQALRKQWAAIESIAADNLKLKEELMLANKFSVNPTTQTAAAVIANLQQQADAYAKKITEEQRLKAEIEHQEEKLRQKIAEQRVQMGGINNSAEQSIKIQRKTRILEDRVQQASIRYNDALTRNKQLRDRIDGLRRERMLFDDLNKKAQRAVARRRQEMTELISNVNELHEAREKAIILQGQVKAQAEKDVANYEAEWHKLTEIIEQDRTSKEARRQWELQEREQQMAALFKQEFSITRRRSSVARAAQSVARAVADERLSPTEKVKQYHEAFEKVKAATGVASIEELVEKMLATEESNYSLFNYVNDLNSEIEKLEDQIGAIRVEIDKYRAEAASKQNDDRTQQLRELEAVLARTEGKAEAYEEKHGQAMQTFNSLRGAVLDMFARIGCATPAIMELLGDDGVTEQNLMKYLGIVEQRTNEVLSKYFALASDDSEAAAERTVAVFTSKRAGTAPPEYVIEPPSTVASAAAGEGEAGRLAAKAAAEEGGEDDLPLGRAALELRAQRMVAAKAEHAVKIKAVRAAAGGAAAAATPPAGGPGARK